MNMIFTHVPFQNVQIMLLANLPDQFSNTDLNVSGENMIPIFGHPHHMILDVVDSM